MRRETINRIERLERDAGQSAQAPATVFLVAEGDREKMAEALALREKNKAAGMPENSDGYSCAYGVSIIELVGMKPRGQAN